MGPVHRDDPQHVAAWSAGHDSSMYQPPCDDTTRRIKGPLRALYRVRAASADFHGRDIHDLARSASAASSHHASKSAGYQTARGEEGLRAAGAPLGRVDPSFGWL